MLFLRLQALLNFVLIFASPLQNRTVALMSRRRISHHLLLPPLVFYHPVLSQSQRLLPPQHTPLATPRNRRLQLNDHLLKVFEKVWVAVPIHELTC